MPKTYQTPDQNQQPPRDSKPRRTFGVYDRPERTAPSLGMMITIAAIIAILIILMLYRLAWGAELEGAIMQPVAVHAVPDFFTV